MREGELTTGPFGAAGDPGTPGPQGPVGDAGSLAGSTALTNLAVAATTFNVSSTALAEYSVTCPVGTVVVGDGWTDLSRVLAVRGIYPGHLGGRSPREWVVLARSRLVPGNLNVSAVCATLH